MNVINEQASPDTANRGATDTGIQKTRFARSLRVAVLAACLGLGALQGVAQDFFHGILSGGRVYQADPTTGAPTYLTQAPDGGRSPFETYGGIAYGTNTIWGVLANGRVYSWTPGGEASFKWNLPEGTSAPLTIYEGLTFGDQSLWGVLGNGSVYKIDPADGSATLLTDLPEGAAAPLDLYAGIAYGNRFLWAILANGRVYRVDPANGTATFMFDAPEGGPSSYRAYEGITFADGFLWGVLADGRVYRIDPATGDADLMWDLPEGDSQPFRIYAGLTFVDTNAPIGTILIDGGALQTQTNILTLTLAAADSGTSPDAFRLSNDGVNFSAWTGLTNLTNHVTSWTVNALDGTKTVYAQFRDSAGNVSTNVTDTITMEYDQDFDGMPDFWELMFFGDVLSAVADDDFDMDGVSNLNEWLSGTDPKDIASVFKGTMTSVLPTSGYVAIWAWDSVVGTTYTITKKTSPTDTLGTVIHQFVGDGTSTAFRITGTVAANVFYSISDAPTKMGP